MIYYYIFRFLSIFRCHKKNVKNMSYFVNNYAIKEKKSGSDIEFVSPDKMALLRSSDKIIMDEYKTQVKIADISGFEKPEEPETSIIKLSFEQLMQLELDEDTGEFNLDDVISAEEMEENNQTCLDMIEEEDEEEKENHIDVKNELNDKEEAFLVAKLSKEGFSVPQQRALLNFYRSGNSIDEETIIFYFSPDMSLEDMNDYITVMTM